jgi:hypothetical protein
VIAADRVVTALLVNFSAISIASNSGP